MDKLKAVETGPSEPSKNLSHLNGSEKCCKSVVMTWNLVNKKADVIGWEITSTIVFTALNILNPCLARVLLERPLVAGNTHSDSENFSYPGGASDEVYKWAASLYKLRGEGVAARTFGRLIVRSHGICVFAHTKF